MRNDAFGPLPVSRMKPESSLMFDALAEGRPVLISRWGQVVAVIHPSGALSDELLAGYVSGDLGELSELTAADINQRSPSRAVALALSGTPHYVTRDHRVYGLLRALNVGELATDLPTEEQVVERQSRLDEFLRATPGASLADVIEFSEAMEREQMADTSSDADFAAPTQLRAAGETTSDGIVGTDWPEPFTQKTVDAAAARLHNEDTWEMLTASWGITIHRHATFAREHIMAAEVRNMGDACAAGESLIAGLNDIGVHQRLTWLLCPNSLTIRAARVHDSSPLSVTLTATVTSRNDPQPFIENDRGIMEVTLHLPEDEQDAPHVTFSWTGEAR